MTYFKTKFAKFFNTKPKKVAGVIGGVAIVAGLSYFGIRQLNPSVTQKLVVFSYYDSNTEEYHLIDSDFNIIEEDIGGEAYNLEAGDRELITATQYSGEFGGDESTLYDMKGKKIGEYSFIGNHGYHFGMNSSLSMDYGFYYAPSIESEDDWGPNGEINVTTMDSVEDFTSGFLTSENEVVAKSEEYLYTEILPDDKVLIAEMGEPAEDTYSYDTPTMKYGLSTTKGDVLVEPKYSRIVYLEPNRYLVQEDLDGEEQVIDDKGKVITEDIKVDGVILGRISENHLVYAKKDDSITYYGILDLEFNEVTDAEFISIPTTTDDGKLIGILDDDYDVRIYNKSGKEVETVDIDAVNIGYGEDNLITVTTEEGYAILDNKGNIKLEKETDNETNFASIYNGGKNLIVAETDADADMPDYEDEDYQYNDNLTYYLTDSKGKKVSRKYEQYYGATPKGDAYIMSNDVDNYEVIDSKGEVVIKDAEYITPVGDNLFVKYAKNDFAIVSPSGKVIKKTDKLQEKK